MAEALDMDVQWDEDSKTVTVGESQSSIQLRIDCLEQALDALVAPKSPEEVALIWAQGLKGRNVVSPICSDISCPPPKIPAYF